MQRRSFLHLLATGIPLMGVPVRLPTEASAKVGFRIESGNGCATAWCMPFGPVMTHVGGSAANFVRHPAEQK